MPGAFCSSASSAAPMRRQRLAFVVLLLSVVVAVAAGSRGARAAKTETEAETPLGCDTFETCTSCVQVSHCGWCAEEGLCLSGSRAEPMATQGSKCTIHHLSWMFDSCGRSQVPSVIHKEADMRPGAPILTPVQRALGRISAAARPGSEKPSDSDVALLKARLGRHISPLEESNMDIRLGLQNLVAGKAADPAPRQLSDEAVAAEDAKLQQQKQQDGFAPALHAEDEAAGAAQHPADDEKVVGGADAVANGVVDTAAKGAHASVLGALVPNAAPPASPGSEKAGAAKDLNVAKALLANARARAKAAELAASQADEQAQQAQRAAAAKAAEMANDAKEDAALKQAEQLQLKSEAEEAEKSVKLSAAESQAEAAEAAQDANPAHAFFLEEGSSASLGLGSGPPPCSSFLSCDACTAVSHCGWCRSDNRCLSGSRDGPSASQQHVRPEQDETTGDSRFSFEPSKCLADHLSWYFDGCERSQLPTVIRQEAAFGPGLPVLPPDERMRREDYEGAGGEGQHVPHPEETASDEDVRELEHEVPNLPAVEKGALAVAIDESGAGGAALKGLLAGTLEGEARDPAALDRLATSAQRAQRRADADNKRRQAKLAEMIKNMPPAQAKLLATAERAREANENAARAAAAAEAAAQKAKEEEAEQVRLAEEAQARAAKHAAELKALAEAALAELAKKEKAEREAEKEKAAVDAGPQGSAARAAAEQYADEVNAAADKKAAQEKAAKEARELADKLQAAKEAQEADEKREALANAKKEQENREAEAAKKAKAEAEAAKAAKKKEENTPSPSPSPSPTPEEEEAEAKAASKTAPPSPPPKPIVPRSVRRRLQRRLQRQREEVASKKASKVAIESNVSGGFGGSSSSSPERQKAERKRQAGRDAAAAATSSPFGGGRRAGRRRRGRASWAPRSPSASPFATKRTGRKTSSSPSPGTRRPRRRKRKW